VKELLEQSVARLREVAPELWHRVGIYSAGLGSRDTEHPIIVAGIQSVYRRACELDAFDLVVIDEAHMIPPDGDGMYRTFLAEARRVNPNLRVIGLTATPFRMTTGSICGPGNILSSICYEISVRELIVQGYLCPLVTKGGREDLDTDGLHVRAGEFVADEVEALMDQAERVESACAEIVEYTRDRKSCLAFASGVQHARHVAETLRRMGGEVATVFGKTPADERAKVIADFRQGRLKYLVNVNVLTHGFDALHVDAVVSLVDVVLGRGRLARENPGGARPRVVHLPFRRRELIPALGADRVARGNEGAALGALLGRGLAMSIRARLADANGIHGTMAQDVPAEVEDEAVLLALAQPETATDHLVV